MATCLTCGQEMLTADSCHTDDNTYRYGNEPHWDDPDFADVSPLPRCRDCNVELGWLHHPGCCIAICESCDRQALMCECVDRIGTQ